MGDPRSHLILVVLGIFSLAGCQQTRPVDFKPGEYSCEYCRMNIVDMRFKTEVISPRGKVHRFDSIECLLSWSKRYPSEVRTQWVSDFYHPEKWVTFQKAHLLKSEKLISPMGGYLSAHETLEELNQARKEFGEK